MDENSKIYVAGHKGLVGSAIWKRLKSKGYNNLVGRTHGELDLMDISAVREFFKEEQPKYVILAAAYVGGIIANNTYRADFIYRNLQIQNNVIIESFNHKVKKLLFLGSTCIYPKDSPQPISEECLLTSPLEYTNEPYAIAKIAGLKMCESFNIQYGTNFISVMPTNLYGPNDNFDLEESHVIPAMIRKIHLAKCLQENNWSGIKRDLTRRIFDDLDGKSTLENSINTFNKYGIYATYLELWGTGKPFRDFLWSEDMADACIFVMNNIDFSDMAKGKQEIRNCHINIGTGEEISIKNLAHLIAKVIGYKGRIKFNSQQPDGTLRKLTDTSKLTSMGWKHQVNLEEGIYRLYKWYLEDQVLNGNGDK
jgi:GDP-L-fucose synthase